MPVLAFSAAFGVSLLLTLLLRAVAPRWGVVAAPRKDRWHHRPTALLGGVAIAAAFSVTTLSMGDFGQVATVVGLALFVAGVGLFDDLWRLNPAAKLVFQAIAAAGALYAGNRLGWTGSLTFDSLLTLLWLVGLANAFNLLDNMDGLAAGVATIGAAAYLVLAVSHGAQADVLMLAAYIGATCGFLVFNLHPASVFMGDAGSLFLGFTLALLSIRLGANLGAGGTTAIVIPVAILSVPIFDTTLVTFVRSLAGRRISVGGRDHSSHRLVALGLPERRAVLVLYALATLAALAGLSAYYFDLSHANIVLGLFLAGLTLFGLHLAQVRVYDAASAPPEHRATVALVLRAVGSRTRVIDVLFDICVVTVAYYTAYRIRFDDQEFLGYFPVFLQSLPIVVATTVSSLWWAGAYRGIWRYFGVRDALELLQGTVLATLASVTAVSYVFRFERYSRAVFAIAGLLAFALLAASRASFRLVHELVGVSRPERRRVLVYGVGDAGMAVLRESRADRIAVQVVGFADEDVATHGRSVQGVKVVGGLDCLLRMVSSRDVDGILVSSPHLDPVVLEALKQACRDAGVFLLLFRWGFRNLLSDDGTAHVEIAFGDAPAELFPDERA
jgi:UDP-GlcNAc:undecaprenyl-phosphate/decaprenyl-phosphate GlcNAc-1-phosphate transferase